MGGEAAGTHSEPMDAETENPDATGTAARQQSAPRTSRKDTLEGLMATSKNIAHQALNKRCVAGENLSFCRPCTCAVHGPPFLRTKSAHVSVRLLIQKYTTTTYRCAGVVHRLLQHIEVSLSTCTEIDTSGLVVEMERCAQFFNDELARKFSSSAVPGAPRASNQPGRHKTTR
jgi:hypothetical protein